MESVGASASLTTLGWHYEAQDIMTFKNNKGVEDNRCRRIDYIMQFNSFLYKRYLEGGVITLFNPAEVPDLYEAFYLDQNLFAELYVKYEKDPTKMKRSVDAKQFFETFLSERFETGRNYIMNVDDANNHSPFRDPITLSNLCTEVMLPTKPFKNVKDETGWVALCTLSAINLAHIVSSVNGQYHIDHKKLERTAEIAVRALDELLDYQDYPVKAAEIHSKLFRPLGVGVINLAYVFAKCGVKYSDGSALKLTHELFEAIQYYLMKASVTLAVEKGACAGFDRLKLKDGILPIDTYNKNVDAIAPFDLKLDWESLRQDIIKYGVRNATVTAIMPSESSAVVSNATNGIEPPVDLTTVKVSKTGAITQLVPEITRLKHKYETRWGMSSCKGYLEVVAVIQKFYDQAISCNTFYNVQKYVNGLVSLEEMMSHVLYAKSLGIKTLYYCLTNDGRKSGTEDESKVKEEVTLDEKLGGCESGACAI